MWLAPCGDTRGLASQGQRCSRERRMRGRGKGAASSQRRHAPGAVGYPPSSSSESAGSTPRARCHPSPPRSRGGLGTEPPPPKAPGASGSWSSRGHFVSAPGTGTRNASARGQRGMWLAPCGDDRTLVGQRPCCCRERRAGVRRGACGRGRGAATKHWSRAPALEGVWKCAGPCLQSGALWRRREHDPGAPVRDARELTLDEGGGRHPLVTAYSFNTWMSLAFGRFSARSGVRA